MGGWAQTAESLRWITIFSSRSKLQAQQGKPEGEAAGAGGGGGGGAAAPPSSPGKPNQGKRIMVSGGAGKAQPAIKPTPPGKELSAA